MGRRVGDEEIVGRVEVPGREGREGDRESCTISKGCIICPHGMDREADSTLGIENPES
jgi:hypothetical protein